MPRALIASLLALSACTTEEARDPGIEANSHVAVHDYFAHNPTPIDILVVVDNTTAMASYQARLPQIAAALARAAEQTSVGMPDLHVGVTTNGGVLMPVLSEHVGWLGERETSYSGSLESELGAELAAVGSSAPEAPRLLEPIMPALLGSSTFLREHAMLGIVTIGAADDASPTMDYAAMVKATKSDPANVIVAGIYPPSSPNLDAFFGAFPNRSTVVSITAEDYAPAFAQLSQIHRSTLEGTCMELPLDLDPETPGDQYDCVAMAYDENGAELARVPMCVGSEDPASGACWEGIHSNVCTEGFLEFHLRGTWGWSLHPRIVLQCVVP